jgi:hypothetical protein
MKKAVAQRGRKNLNWSTKKIQKKLSLKCKLIMKKWNLRFKKTHLRKQSNKAKTCRRLFGNSWTMQMN